MQSIKYRMKMRATMVAFFAFLSAASAAATTIAPFVMRA
jgi:hypothetical protein